ncbi:hypothetical protein K469DRAFT_720565 [Zopfia rhizophila CBS 207.26]|uniref:Cytochrome P450 n=1 Tax=Zopfia rhizophila CBS 207.26 TaxID=1314779 RepID=A0A6A6EK49_9PEZI|nr:hypothetical protein K469DRAFT_720565 [Zopfia rhizophila CBS 207.26]
MCVGMQLAFAEIYLTLGGLFGPGGFGGGEEGKLELYETSERDVGVESDWFNPVPWDRSKGVRVVVK